MESIESEICSIYRQERAGECFHVAFKYSELQPVAVVDRCRQKRRSRSGLAGRSYVVDVLKRHCQRRFGAVGVGYVQDEVFGETYLYGLVIDDKLVFLRSGVKPVGHTVVIGPECDSAVAVELHVELVVCDFEVLLSI